ncbi:MAG: hypothetical protein ACK5B5_04890 [Bacteroidota bacterium]
MQIERSMPMKKMPPSVFNNPLGLSIRSLINGNAMDKITPSITNA